MFYNIQMSNIFEVFAFICPFLGFEGLKLMENYNLDGRCKTW